MTTTSDGLRRRLRPRIDQVLAITAESFDADRLARDVIAEVEDALRVPDGLRERLLMAVLDAWAPPAGPHAVPDAPAPSWASKAVDAVLSDPTVAAALVAPERGLDDPAVLADLLRDTYNDEGGMIVLAEMERLRARIKELEALIAAGPCPHVVVAPEGTAYCTLAEANMSNARQNAASVAATLAGSAGGEGEEREWRVIAEHPGESPFYICAGETRESAYEEGAEIARDYASHGVPVVVRYESRSGWREEGAAPPSPSPSGEPGASESLAESGGTLTDHCGTLGHEDEPAVATYRGYPVTLRCCARCARDVPDEEEITWNSDQSSKDMESKSGQEVGPVSRYEKFGEHTERSDKSSITLQTGETADRAKAVELVAAMLGHTDDDGVCFECMQNGDDVDDAVWPCPLAGSIVAALAPLLSSPAQTDAHEVVSELAHLLYRLWRTGSGDERRELGPEVGAAIERYLKHPSNIDLPAPAQTDGERQWRVVYLENEGGLVEDIVRVIDARMARHYTKVADGPVRIESRWVPTPGPWTPEPPVLGEPS